MTLNGDPQESSELDAAPLPEPGLLADPLPADSTASGPVMVKGSRTRRKRKVEPATPEPIVSTLTTLRDRQGMSQKQVALLMGIQQANVSRLESRGDVCLSSLKSYIGAMGGKLEIVARIGQDVFTLQLEDTQGTKRPRKIKSVDDALSSVKTQYKSQ